MYREIDIDIDIDINMKHNYHVGEIVSIHATLHQKMTIQAEHDGNHNRHYQERVGDPETLRNSNGHLAFRCTLYV